MKQSPTNLVLGIDPGFATTGYAFILEKARQIKIIEYGVISTSAKLGFPQRLVIINRELTNLIKQFKPTSFAIEKIYFAKNAKTAIDVGQARGVLLLTAILHNLPIYEFTPLQIKQAICGYGQADKCQIQNMLKNILKLKEIPKPDDAADALAIAITFLQSKNYLDTIQA